MTLCNMSRPGYEVDETSRDISGENEYIHKEGFGTLCHGLVKRVAQIEWSELY